MPVLQLFDYLCVIFFKVGKNTVRAVFFAIFEYFIISAALLFVKGTEAEKTVNSVNSPVAGVVFAVLVLKEFITHIITPNKL